MDALAAAEAKMRADGQPAPAITAFRRQFGKLEAGVDGRIPSEDLTPVSGVPRLEDLPDAPPDALARTVVVKLNGGLGTSMGLRRPKSLIEARDGRTFLELILAQAQALRETWDVELPLILLDSFNTREATAEAIAGHDGATSVMQHRIPRLRADDHFPVERPQDPAAEWCPPGHGDVYLALRTSGALEALLERGIRQAFLSNADNLGATVEPRIAGWAAGRPFVMEVVEGDASDRKGGHLAHDRDGRLVLRETAQAPPEEFRDFRRWRYYNVNSLWVDLEALAAQPDLDLPLIVNRKRLGDEEVLQLETAMGAAVGAFDDAALIHVPRTRFAPVKTTDDLLVLRSDAYALTGDARVVRTGDTLPFVDLDREVYADLAAFEARFPHGAPSLAAAERLVVRGDVTFGAGVRVEGAVTLEGPARIPDGTVLDG
jgi:UTP--glucose-1-phosphate uridylyltransferase